MDRSKEMMDGIYALNDTYTLYYQMQRLITQSYILHHSTRFESIIDFKVSNDFYISSFLYIV